MRLYNKSFIVCKALPPTKGHIYLIDTAASLCNKVYVLICSIKSEPIPGILRFNWLKSIYESSKQVEIIWCNEELPQYPEQSENFWDIWVDVFNRYIPKGVDVIFSSENYGKIYSEYLGINNYLVDLERKNVPISGTLVRNNPFKYWEYIPDIVKPFFMKRIALMGPESTGKSEMSKRLSKYFNTEYVEEYGRTVYEQNGNSVSIEDFIKISRGRQMLEDSALKISNKILICDTEDLTTYYLSKEYYPNDYKKVEDFFIKQIKEKPKYDLYILYKPDCEYVQDGSRIFGDKRWEQYSVIKNLLVENGCNFFEIGGDWENRFKESCILIDKIYYKNF